MSDLWIRRLGGAIVHTINLLWVGVSISTLTHERRIGYGSSIKESSTSLQCATWVLVTLYGALALTCSDGQWVMAASAWVWWGVLKLFYLRTIYLLLNAVAPCLLDAAQCRQLEKRSQLSTFIVNGREYALPYPWVCHAVNAVLIYPFALYYILPEQLSFFALWELVLPWTVAFTLAELASKIVTAVEMTKTWHSQRAEVAIHALNWAAGLSSAAMIYALWTRYDFDSMGAHVATFLTTMLASRIIASLQRFHRHIVYSPLALLNVEHYLVRLFLCASHALLFMVTWLSLFGMAGRIAWCLAYYTLRFIGSQWDKPFGPTPDWRWTSGLHAGWVALLHLPAIALSINYVEHRGLRKLFDTVCAIIKATWRVKSISRRVTAAELHRYDDVCAICLAHLWFGSRLFQRCRHIFHERCLVEMVSWGGKNAFPVHCPTCRQVVEAMENRRNGTGRVEQLRGQPGRLDADQDRLRRELLELDPPLFQLIIDYRASLAGVEFNGTN